MSVSGLPFDDIRELMAALPEADSTALGLAVQRSGDIAAAFPEMGAVGPVAGWLAGWSGHSPLVQRPLVAIFAGTHGVVRNVAAPEQVFGEKTQRTVTRLAAGGAPVNQVCAANEIGLKVFDLALQLPVEDICKTDALDEKASAATIGFGMEAIAGGVDLLCLAAIGQGSLVGNIALAHLMFGVDISQIDGADGFGDLVSAVIDCHKGAKGDPLELLRRIGGREHSAIAGAILAARTSHIPVVLDGLTALVVAGLLERQQKGSCAHCRIATGGQGGLYETLGRALQIPAILQGHEPSNDGTVGALALATIKSLAAIHRDVVIKTD